MFELYDSVKLKSKEKYAEIEVPVDKVGVIIDIVGDGEAYTVEFMDDEGYTYEKSVWPYYEAEDLELVRKKSKR